MWYILYMNKDVIYVEPEDDITDIILKIEKSKEKIVALVPPKKAGVFRSVVNIKLISKSGTTSGKKIVLVTTDPSILRLAGAAKIPTTKNLQTAPAIPEVDAEAETASKEELVEESDGTVETEEDVEELEGGDKDKEAKGKDNDEKDEDSDDGDEDKDEDEDEDEDEAPKSKAKPKKKKPSIGGNKVIDWIRDHKKLSIAGGIGALVLVLFLVWAFTIAPAVTVTVNIKTTSNNFSEGVSFVNSLNEENAAEGKFYLEEKKIESVKEVEFEATGKKNVGEKATGEVTVIARLDYDDGGTKVVNAGDSFMINGLSFIADNGVTMRYNGKDDSVCSNIDDDTSIGKARAEGCKIYAIVRVTASEPGTKYNISPSESGWTTTADVAAYSTKAMAGGTDKEITVVQQSDFDKAKNELTGANEEENKEKLLSDIKKDMLTINSSFKQSTADAVATPAVGEEVKEGEKAKLKAVTTASVYVIDKTKVEEFITKKADLKDDQKIYDMKDPFVENFIQTSDGYTGKLKTSYLTGPKITVSSVVDLIKGKGFGDAQHLLKDISGITEVKMDGSFPWVTAVPSDTNKITVNLEVKDQDGNKVEQKEKNDKEEKQEDKGTTEDDDKKQEEKE